MYRKINTYIFLLINILLFTISSVSEAKNYTTDHGLLSNHVEQVQVYAPNGNICVVSSTGLSVFRDGERINSESGILKIQVYGNKIYSITKTRLLVSEDGGKTFVQKGKSHIGDLARGYFAFTNLVDFCVVKNKIYIIHGANHEFLQYFDALLVSDDGGENFIEEYSTDKHITSICASEFDDKIYITTSGGFLISRDGGRSFVLKGKWSPCGYIEKVYEFAGKIYVVTHAGLFISTNGGESFSVITKEENGLASNYIYDMCIEEDHYMYVATNMGLSVSRNGGSTFENITKQDGLIDNFVTTIYAQYGKVYVGTLYGLTVMQWKWEPWQIFNSKPELQLINVR